MMTVVKYLLLPSNLIFVSLSAGLLLLCSRATRSWGNYLTGFALCLYLLFGTGPVAFLLLGHLEYQIVPATAQERHRVRTLVVLTGHAEPDPDIPLSSRVNSTSAIRLLEVLNQSHLEPDLNIIVSGGGGVPEIMRDVLVSSGVPEQRIRVDANSLSTYESAKNLSSMVGTMPFLLVTSAGHMPRAMGVFLKAGGDPRPVPTHYMTRRNWLAIQYLPKLSHLEYSDLAVFEYSALVWYRINGWL